MRTKVQKWGNSLALRIPAAFARETGMSDGADVDLTLEDGRLIVTSGAVRYSLEALLGKVTEENRHGSVDTGAPQGGEAW